MKRLFVVGKSIFPNSPGFTCFTRPFAHNASNDAIEHCRPYAVYAAFEFRIIFTKTLCCEGVIFIGQSSVEAIAGPIKVKGFTSFFE